MDKHITIMLLPEREKGVKSIRIPRVIYKGIGFISFIFFLLLLVLAYDYVKILRQVYVNKHLARDNKQLKEQIKLFQMKINTLTSSLERIEVFEKKLRTITGLKEEELKKSYHDEKDIENVEGASKVYRRPQSEMNSLNFTDSEIIYKDKEFNNLKSLYEKKIATNFGLHSGYRYTKEWSSLTKQSFALAGQFALFDYKFGKIKKFMSSLERRMSKLDVDLLDRASFLRSLPTLLPTQGWITSFYGPRMSHYSGRIKMHEGIDIGAKVGKPVVAPADAIVTYSGKKPGFGYFVQLDHGYGLETIFAHSSKLLVRKGDKILRGQEIAKVGSTGYSTGPHVHYEVRVNGTPVDPLYFILD